MAESLKRVPKNSSMSSPKMTCHGVTQLTLAFISPPLRAQAARRERCLRALVASVPLFSHPRYTCPLSWQVSGARYGTPKACRQRPGAKGLMPKASCNVCRGRKGVRREGEEREGVGREEGGRRERAIVRAGRVPE